MEQKQLDFKGLSDALLSRAGEWLSDWLPGGRVVGREYKCGNLRGGPGDSMSVNTQTGSWSDFAGAEDDKGGDLISLFAKIQGIKQGEAAKQLADQINFRLSQEPVKPAAAPKTNDLALAPPPHEHRIPSFLHQTFGTPTEFWAYKSANEQVMFYVARYDHEGKKQFSPWCWTPTEGRFIQKGWPAPRPLYGLDWLAEFPKLPVMVVEGEKAADAAREIVGENYVVVTWPNGAKAVNSADWTPLHGRQILIWPDADAPGREAAAKISALLLPHCQVKLLNITDRDDGWDAWNALDEGWDWDKLVAWAKPRAQLLNQPTVIQAIAQANGNGARAAVQVNISADDQERPSSSAAAIHDELGIAVNKNGNPIINLHNALLVIERLPDFKDLLWFDEFHQRYFTTWKTGVVREWEGIDENNLTLFMQRDLGLSLMTETIAHQAAINYAQKHIRNEPREWMESLTWDGQGRIDTCLIDCFGAKDDEYTRTASKNFFIGMAARIYRPGCQLDNMIILESIQGAGKTRAMRLLGGPWYTEPIDSVLAKDFFLSLQGRLIVEIAEMDSFSRAEVTKIKQVITCTNDRYRSPYATSTTDHPRMSVFVGTTNEKDYLKDTTGARRFWPIKCGVINQDMIAQQREQLFAEAVARYKAGEHWWEMPAGVTEQEQESRRQNDVWESVIGDYIEFLSETTVKDLALDALKIEIGKVDKWTQIRIGKVLNTLGWEKHNLLRNGRQVMTWQRKEGQAPREPAPPY